MHRGKPYKGLAATPDLNGLFPSRRDGSRPSTATRATSRPRARFRPARLGILLSVGCTALRSFVTIPGTNGWMMDDGWMFPSQARRFPCKNSMNSLF
jgi:hypothetical protein